MPRPFYRSGWIARSRDQFRTWFWNRLWPGPFPTAITAFLSTVAGLVWNGEHLSLYITNAAMFVWLL